jgi:hypothetical protein
MCLCIYIYTYVYMYICICMYTIYLCLNMYQICVYIYINRYILREVNRHRYVDSCSVLVGSLSTTALLPVAPTVRDRLVQPPRGWSAFGVQNVSNGGAVSGGVGSCATTRVRIEFSTMMTRTFCSRFLVLLHTYARGHTRSAPICHAHYIGSIA